MLNKSSALPGTARLKAILEDPDTILQIENPTEKMQLAAVQKSRNSLGIFLLPQKRYSSRLSSPLRKASS